MSNYEQEEQPQTNEQQPQIAQDQPQFTESMWYPAFDHYTQQYQWTMKPEYHNLFQQYISLISELEGTVNNKWSQDQVNAYQLFLKDLKDYINNYIWNGTANYYDAFQATMASYGENQNPVGFELYQIQIDYLQKKSEGYDFKFEKKKNKAQQPKQQHKPKIREEKAPKEEQIIRKDDPKITAKELQDKEFDPARYTDLKGFYKENVNLVFIGHVDSGKSTLTGNIIKELKQVDEQELMRNKQQAKENHMQAWELAFIADVDPNERKRGKTVECSKMMFALEKRRFTLFDAPGHKNYVPNMIMGACQADIAILVISAREGEFQSGFEKDGQTKEHAMLATALGVKSMIAAVTKMNTVDWSEERYKHIKSQVTPFLENSCGFHNVPFIPIDSIENRNVHTRIVGAWYDGPCLVEMMNETEIPHRDPDGPLRIPVIDKFKDVGNFFLYGKLESGKIAYENQEVTLLPSRKTFIIKEIINAKDEKLPYALAGENVKLRVKHIEQDQVHRGDIICSNMNYCQESMQFKAELTVLEIPESKKLMSQGYECVIHMHAISEEAEVGEVQAKVSKQTKKLVKATFLTTGETGRITLKLKNSVCMEKFDFMPSLGRFTLRDEGKTIGYGTVLKIKPAKNLTKEQKNQLGPKHEEMIKKTEQEVKKVEE